MNNNLVMDWDDVVESDGQEFILLPEGDYNFTVTDLERGRFPGSAKMPASNKVTITVLVETNEGSASVRTDLILNRTLEWKLAAFFRCIGLKKKGEPMKMEWNKVIGSQGRAHFKHRVYKVGDEERTTNDLDRFYDYDPSFFQPGWVTQADSVKEERPSWEKGTF